MTQEGERAIREFELQIDREWAAMQEDLAEWVVWVLTETLASLVEKSPVDVGTFQNNWLVSIGVRDGRTIPFPGNFSAENGQTIAAYAQTEGFPVVYLQNNLPYAGRLEDGYSGQAPAGVVGVTVTEMQARIAADAA